MSQAELECELIDELHTETKKVIFKLNQIWNEIGIDDNTRKVRTQLFCKHVKDLYDDMLEEAEDSRTSLVNRVDSLVTDITKLATELRVSIQLPNDDQPLWQTRTKLESIFEKYSKIHEDRIAEVKRLEGREKLLCTSLGKPCRRLYHKTLPTEEDIHEFRTYLEELSDLKFRNEEIFLKTKSSIIEIMNELKINPSLDFERKIVLEDDNAFQVTDENMAMLDELHKSLQNQLEQTKSKIGELRETLNNLWELLEENPEVRSKFLEKYQGNSVDTLRALKAEIKRCQEKKKENIKLFVKKLRNDLVTWWDKCKFGPEQRAEFIHFESDCFTEDLLTLHELQIEKVKKFYEANKHIYELMNKRDELWERMIELEKRSNQPDRYKNRGGQLLREEKERKTVQSYLPKIEKELSDLVTNYEHETGVPFLIFGKSLNEILIDAWEEHKENKHITLSAKKHARDNTHITPSKSRICTPRTLRTLQTPNGTLSTTKRKLLATPSFNLTKKLRVCDEKILRTAPSKMQVTATTVRRASIERKKRVERTKRRSQLAAECSMASTISEYERFEKEIHLNPKCRSSLFPANKELKVPKIEITKAPHTPRKPLQCIPHTPQRTPSQMSLRSRSPKPSNRLVAKNLPIII